MLSVTVILHVCLLVYRVLWWPSCPSLSWGRPISFQLTRPFMRPAWQPRWTHSEPSSKHTHSLKAASTIHVRQRTGWQLRALGNWLNSPLFAPEQVWIIWFAKQFELPRIVKMKWRCVLFLKFFLKLLIFNLSFFSSVSLMNISHAGCGMGEHGFYLPQPLLGFGRCK